MSSNAPSTPPTPQKRSRSISQQQSLTQSSSLHCQPSAKCSRSDTNLSVNSTSHKSLQSSPSIDAIQSDNTSALSSLAQSLSDSSSVICISPEKEDRSLPLIEKHKPGVAQHYIPFAKIRSIMASTPETLTANDEGIYAMTKTAEAFVEMLTQGAYVHSDGQILTYSNLADFVQESGNLNHIREIVPRKVKFSTVQDLVLGAKNAKKE